MRRQQRKAIMVFARKQHATPFEPRADSDFATSLDDAKGWSSAQQADNEELPVRQQERIPQVNWYEASAETGGC